MLISDFRTGDYVEYTYGPGEHKANFINPGNCHGIVVNVIELEGAQFLEVANGYQQLEDFCTSNDAEKDDSDEDYWAENYRDMDDPSTKGLAPGDRVYILPIQVRSRERKCFVLEANELTNSAGERAIEVKCTPLEYLLFSYNKGDCRMETLFSTDNPETHEIRYSAAYFRYLLSGTSERKYYATKMLSSDFDSDGPVLPFFVKKVSDKPASDGSFIHTVINKVDGRTYFLPLGIRVAPEDTVFLEKEKYRIVERPYLHTCATTGKQQEFMLKWLRLKK
jgi:hypothetical protein